MKTYISLVIMVAIAATTLAIAACNTGNDKTTTSKENDKTGDTSMAMHQQLTNHATGTQNAAMFPIKAIIAGYLQMKNALANDNANDAAAAGKSIVELLNKVNQSTLSADQMKAYADLHDDIKENAEHIGSNADKIKHQREHFMMLSSDISDLIKAFGNNGQTLYKDFCPMANNGKGAIWISETKDIKNPYLGKSMPTCGTIKEEMK